MSAVPPDGKPLLHIVARMTAAPDLTTEKARARKHYDYWIEEELKHERNCLISDIFGGLLKSSADENSGTGISI
jgi:hypothetical protein